MTAYMLGQARVTHEEQYDKYRQAVMPLIESFGGRIVGGGGDTILLEGRQDERQMILFAFPSAAAIQEFWTSSEYKVIRSLRLDAAQVEMWALPGLPQQG